MKRLSLILIPTLLLLSIGCDDDKYNDDQYGDHCLVSKVEVDNASTTTISYDQYDRVLTMSFSMPQQPSGLMEVTYNNGMAFIDYYNGQQLTQTAEVDLNAAGDMTHVVFSDTDGSETGDLTFVYNNEGNLINISGQEPVMGVNGSVTIQWTGGNPVRFIGTESTIDCEYFGGQRSSFYLGMGNVALLYQPLAANIAMMYSTDLLKTFDSHSAMGQTLEIVYDKDSDDKVREIYYSTTSGDAFGTSFITYECHTPH